MAIEKGNKRLLILGLKQLISSPTYLLCMLVVPIICALFFTFLMYSGSPQRLPIGVVDNDRSKTSRSLIRNLDSMSEVDVVADLESFYQANQYIKENKIYAFMQIPENFERDLTSNKTPEIGFFSNEAYYVPGLFSSKALKMSGVLANGNAVKTVLEQKDGYYPYQYNSVLQPIILDVNPLGNPWVNYSVYICNVFVPAVLQLMILLVTVYTLGVKIKNHTSRRLLVIAKKSMFRLIVFTLLPQTFIFTLMGWCINLYLWGILQFPLNTALWHMLLATFLMVTACQSIGVFMLGTIPILRLGMSSASLYGVLAFSVVGMSLPSMAMYAPLRFINCVCGSV